MAGTVRTVEPEGALPAGPPPSGARVVARFEGVRHSTESFIVDVHVGEPSDESLAGQVAMYGHGTVYGGQEQLDAALAPYHADVDLTPALTRLGWPSTPPHLSLIVRDANGDVMPADAFRFSRVRLLPLQ